MKIPSPAFRSPWYVYVGLLATAALFIWLPLNERALFAMNSPKHWADALLLLLVIGAGTLLISGVREHFSAFRRVISGRTLFFLQWSISLFIWLVLSFPLTYTYIEWGYGTAAAQSGLFGIDIAFSTLLFGMWAAAGFAYPPLIATKKRPANQLLMADPISS